MEGFGCYVHINNIHIICMYVCMYVRTFMLLVDLYCQSTKPYIFSGSSFVWLSKIINIAKVLSYMMYTAY